MTNLSNLWATITRGDVQRLRTDCAGIDLSRQRNSEGLSPILAALTSFENTYELADQLLQLGADANDPDPSTGKTPLHIACSRFDQPLVQLLLLQKPHIDARDHHGNSPLMDAVFRSQGRDELVTVLLKAGADPDLANRHGVTPRSLAQRAGLLHVLRAMNKSDELTTE